MKFFIKLLLVVSFITYSNTSFGADWFGYVVNDGNSTVVPVNLTTNIPGTPINTGGSGSTNIAITPNALTAYVVNNLSNDVTPINLTNNTTGTLISVGTNPVVVVITPDGQTAYVTNNGSHDLSAINIGPNTSSIVFDFGLDNNPWGIAITPDGMTAYIVIQSGLGTLANTVVRLDLASNTLVGLPIPVANGFNIAITPDGQKAYVTTFFDGTVVPIDLVTNLPQTPIPVGLFPFDIAITANGNTAFVTNQGDGTVTPIDIATNTPGSPITVGSAPFGLAITPDSQTVYVSNFGSDDVTPISTSTQTPGTNIPMASGGAPYGIAITPDQAPTASFTSTPAPAGSPTSFDASSSTSPVGTIAIYSWDFGDGNTATVFTPTINHTYNTSGNFLVTLTVTNSAGTSTTQTFTGKTVSNNGGPSATTSQFVSISSSTPLPPSNFIGVIEKNKFLNKTECVLKAKWDASPSTNVAFYRIYKKGIVVEEVPATSPLVFTTCLHNCSGKGFEITAVSTDNLESSHLKIKIVHE